MNDIELCDKINELEEQEHELLELCKKSKSFSEKMNYIKQMHEISAKEVQLLNNNPPANDKIADADETYFKTKNYITCGKHKLEMNLISYKPGKIGEVNVMNLVYECEKCGKNKQINIMHIID